MLVKASKGGSVRKLAQARLRLGRRRRSGCSVKCWGYVGGPRVLAALLRLEKPVLQHPAHARSRPAPPLPRQLLPRQPVFQQPCGGRQGSGSLRGCKFSSSATACAVVPLTVAGQGAGSLFKGVSGESGGSVLAL